MHRPIERFHFNEPILNTTKLGLIRLSVDNSELNMFEKHNKFGYRQKCTQKLYNVEYTYEISLKVDRITEKTTGKSEKAEIINKVMASKFIIGADEKQGKVN